MHLHLLFPIPRFKRRANMLRGLYELTLPRPSPRLQQRHRGVRDADQLVLPDRGRRVRELLQVSCQNAHEKDAKLQSIFLFCSFPSSRR
jgi:hypothetical protein